jgi:hypothetical protein
VIAVSKLAIDHVGRLVLLSSIMKHFSLPS